MDDTRTEDEVLASIKVDDKVWFEEGKYPFTVQARNRRYIVCTRPFYAKKTVLYTIIDTVEKYRGPDNLVFSLGYETREDCERSLAQFERKPNPVELSYRRKIPLKLLKVSNA